MKALKCCLALYMLENHLYTCYRAAQGVPWRQLFVALPTAAREPLDMLAHKKAIKGGGQFPCRETCMHAQLVARNFVHATSSSKAAMRGLMVDAQYIHTAASDERV